MSFSCAMVFISAMPISGIPGMKKRRGDVRARDGFAV